MKDLVRFTVMISLAGVFPLTATASVLDLPRAQSRLEFLAVGRPSALKIRGKSLSDKPFTGSVKIENQELKGQITTSVDALTTGIELRDKHMKEKYLEVAKYPTAELTFTRFPVPEKGDEQKTPFEGTLKLHGITQPVKGQARIKHGETELEIEAEFPLELSAFQIAIPSYLGITVADQVTVTSQLKVPVQKSAP